MLRLIEKADFELHKVQLLWLWGLHRSVAKREAQLVPSKVRIECEIWASASEDFGAYFGDYSSSMRLFRESPRLRILLPGFKLRKDF